MSRLFHNLLWTNFSHCQSEDNALDDVWKTPWWKEIIHTWVKSRFVRQCLCEDNLHIMRKEESFNEKIRRITPHFFYIWTSIFISTAVLIITNQSCVKICSCYRTVLRAIWQIFSGFFMFCNLFHEPLAEWSNSKIWETRTIIANIARSNMS